jgi:xanthine/uracil/vitamin C permease (AzgA family)
LVSVGALIFAGNLKNIHWGDMAIGASAFITIVMIVLTYSA